MTSRADVFTDIQAAARRQFPDRTSEQAVAEYVRLHPEAYQRYRDAATGTQQLQATKKRADGSLEAERLDQLAEQVAGEAGITKASAYERVLSSPEGERLRSLHRFITGV
ncbi:MAG: hypothetical protein ACJ76P_12965 [Actinomycetota bacterium]